MPLRLDSEKSVGGAAGTVAGAPRGPFGSLTFSGGHTPFRYRFTAEDVLWTARFLVGEAGGADDRDNEAVIWAMFNRFALFTHRVYPTFQSFLRAYSTPLQPVLKSVGAARRHVNRPGFVRTGGFYRGTQVPRGQLQRHRDLQTMPWSRLSRGARNLALRALHGEVPNPVGNASEFASTRVYFRDRHGRYPQSEDEWRTFTADFARRKGWGWIGPVPGVSQARKNAFFVDRRAARLPVGAVRVIAPAGPAAEAELAEPPPAERPRRACAEREQP